MEDATSSPVYTVVRHDTESALVKKRADPWRKHRRGVSDRRLGDAAYLRTLPTTIS